MAKKKAPKSRPAPRAKKTVKKAASDPLFARVKGAERRVLGHVRLEVGRAGAARVKRMIYPRDFAGRST